MRQASNISIQRFFISDSEILIFIPVSHKKPITQYVIIEDSAHTGYTIINHGATIQEIFDKYEIKIQ